MAALMFLGFNLKAIIAFTMKRIIVGYNHIGACKGLGVNFLNYHVNELRGVWTRKGGAYRTLKPAYPDNFQMIIVL